MESTFNASAGSSNNTEDEWARMINTMASQLPLVGSPEWYQQAGTWATAGNEPATADVPWHILGDIRWRHWQPLPIDCKDLFVEDLRGCARMGPQPAIWYTLLTPLTSIDDAIQSAIRQWLGDHPNKKSLLSITPELPTVTWTVVWTQFCHRFSERMSRFGKQMTDGTIFYFKMQMYKTNGKDLLIHWARGCRVLSPANEERFLRLLQLDTSRAGSPMTMTDSFE